MSHTHIEIITDASMVGYVGSVREGLQLSVGAGIARLRGSDGVASSQVFRGVVIFESTQSFEAEIITGLKCLKILETQYTLSACNITWHCDLHYLDTLIHAPDKIQNQTLKKLVFDILEMIPISQLVIRYPSTSGAKKYHYYCHRICSEVRQQILNSELNPHETIKQVFKKHASWSLLESSL